MSARKPLGLRKATVDECIAYMTTKPVYPLGYVANMYDTDGNKHAVNIEDLRGSWSRPDPVWEIIMPPGYVSEDCHSLLCFDLDDVRGRLACGLDKCDCSECSEHWEAQS